MNIKKLNKIKKEVEQSGLLWYYKKEILDNIKSYKKNVLKI